MTTKKHTAGKLICVDETTPGMLIYLRPDHKKYDPEFFAIVLPYKTATSHEFAIVEEARRRIFQIFDQDRAIEVVGQEVTAACTGLSRAEIARAVRASRNSNDAQYSLRNDLAAYIFDASTGRPL